MLEESNNMDEEKMAWIACMESYAHEKECDLRMEAKSKGGSE